MAVTIFGSDDDGGASTGYLNWFGWTPGADYSGFWDSVVADANSYLNTNGPDVNVTLNAGAVAFLYNQYQANGDDGLITNLMYNNDASQSYGTDDNGSANAAPNITANPGSGSVANAGNGSLTNYYACTDCGIGSPGNSNVADRGGNSIFTLGYIFGSSHDSYGNPVGYAQIAIGFKDPGYGYQSYAWIQTVNRAGKRFVDMTPASQASKNYPFYFSSAELLSQSTANFTSVFGDQAAMLLGHGNITWTAEVTLVGVNGSQITPIATFTWGVSTNGILTVPMPYYETIPSFYHQNIIFDYNFTH